MLKTFFDFPKSVVIQQKMFGYSSNNNNIKLLKDEKYKTDFMCKFVNSIKSIKLTTNDLEIINFDKNNLYNNEYSKLIKQYKILKLKFLCFHINRNTGTSKSYHEVIAPDKIQNTKLKAIIVHYGFTVNSGHYVTYVKNNNIWVLYDDLNDAPINIGPQLHSDIFKNCTDLIYI